MFYLYIINLFSSKHFIYKILHSVVILICFKAHIDTGAESKMQELKHRLHDVQSELDETMEVLKKQKDDYVTVKEEVRVF